MFKPIGEVAEAVAVQEAPTAEEIAEDGTISIGVPRDQRNIDSLDTGISHGGDVMSLNSLCVACEGKVHGGRKLVATPFTSCSYFNCIIDA
jgi:hypothetical protein